MNFSGLRRSAFLLLACAVAGLAQSYQVSAHYTKHEYQIPMRDGIRLFTAVYEPNNQTKKYPVLMTRTPYSVSPYGESNYPDMLGPSTRFDADGFIYVFQDVRGRNMSEGVWQEMTPEQDHQHSKATDESTDCYDTVEWLLKNLKSHNGKVGLIGISYPGFYAAAGMIDAHPAVVAASPQAPVTDLYLGDDAYHNGALYLLANYDFYTSFTEQHGPQYPDPDSEFSYGTKDGYRFFLHMGPVVASEKYLHRGNRYWTETYTHDTYDVYWRRRSLLPHLRDIRPAVLLVGGWLDAEDLSGTLKMYRALRAQSPGTKVTFVMGPWPHGGWEDRNALSSVTSRSEAHQACIFRMRSSFHFFGTT